MDAKSSVIAIGTWIPLVSPNNVRPWRSLIYFPSLDMQVLIPKLIWQFLELRKLRLCCSSCFHVTKSDKSNSRWPILTRLDLFYQPISPALFLSMVVFRINLLAKTQTLFAFSYLGPLTFQFVMFSCFCILFSQYPSLVYAVLHHI